MAAASHTTISSLPPELLALIFTKLGDATSRFVCSRVSRGWRQAALEPGSPELAIAVAADVLDDDPLPSLRSRALHTDYIPNQVLSAARAVAVLRSPICGALLRVRLSVAFARRASYAHDEEEQTGFHLAAVLEALPPCVRRLEIIAAGESIDDCGVILGRMRLGARPFATSLRELAINCAAPNSLGSINSLEQVPRLPALEVLEADLFDVDAAGLLRLLPALKRVASLYVGPVVRGPALAALAAAGVRCLRLRTDEVDLSGPAAAGLAVLEPPAFGRVEGAGSADLYLQSTVLPDELPSATCLAGVESLTMVDCELRPPVLRWLASGAHVATLRRAVLHTDLDNCTPYDLLSAVEEWREGVHAEIWIQNGWSEAELVLLFEAVMASPRLMRDARIEHWGPILPPQARAAQARYLETRARLEARPASPRAGPDDGDLSRDLDLHLELG